MDGEMNGAPVEGAEPQDQVLQILDTMREAYVAGKISAVAFASVAPDGTTGPAGWAGKSDDWGATLGFQIHLLDIRYVAMILAAATPNMSEVDAADLPEATRREHGLG